MTGRKLPEEFIARMRLLLGEEHLARYLAAFSEEPPVSIRLNPRKAQPSTAVGFSAVPWCSLGYYLAERPNFTFDPLLHAGCYYVQEAASMFIHHVLSSLFAAPCPPLSVLDLCAAPGGKSTCAVSALPEGSRLWANDPVHQRASILSENIWKWGYPGCIVTNSYPKDYVKAGMLFDVILCDVPCSGEGMFRKDQQTIGEWSPQQVEKCWRLQRDIVSDAWRCLLPGGLLVYSTCTFNTKENEENVRWMMEEFGAELLSVPTLSEWNITGSLLPGFNGPVYRFIPGITRSEGLFVAVLRKLESTDHPHLNKQKAKLDSLKIIHSIAEFSVDMPMVDLDYETAISYLRGESIVLPTDTPRGIVSVAFQGHCLGQVKNIGTRANNLYPKEWRIRSTYVPSEPPIVL